MNNGTKYKGHYIIRLPRKWFVRTVSGHKIGMFETLDDAKSHIDRVLKKAAETATDISEYGFNF